MFGHFYSPLSFLSSFSLSLGDGPIQTEILSQRAAKPATINQSIQLRGAKNLENQLNVVENINKKNKTENEHIIITETENSDSADPDPVNDVTLQPILTLPGRLAEEREKLDTNLRSKQTWRVTLDVGGRYSATSKGTLL